MAMRRGPRRSVRGPAPSSGGAAYVFIGEVAARFGVHPQTLRLYEREGLIRPPRTAGNTRLYDQETVERLEIILTLTRDLGVNLAGVEVILDLRTRLAKIEGEVGRLMDALRAVAADQRAKAAAAGHAPGSPNALAIRPRTAIVVLPPEK